MNVPKLIIILTAILGFFSLIFLNYRDKKRGITSKYVITHDVVFTTILWLLFLVTLLVHFSK